MYLLAIYIGYLLLWTVVSVSAWATSIIIRKNLMLVVAAFAIIFNFILGTLLFLGYLYVTFSFFKTGQILAAIILIIGGGIILGSFGVIQAFLMMPFNFLTAFFTASIDK